MKVLYAQAILNYFIFNHTIVFSCFCGVHAVVPRKIKCHCLCEAFLEFSLKACLAFHATPKRLSFYLYSGYFAICVIFTIY